MQNVSIFWVIVAIISFVVEIITPTFFTIWFGVAAIIALVFDLLDTSFALQVAIFLVTSPCSNSLL